LILLSVTGATSFNHSTYEIFKTKRIDTVNPWPQYEYSLYNNFKAHWTNGVNMYDKYGQHELANNCSTVCVTTDPYDFDHLLDKFDKLPKNTIIFDHMFRDDPGMFSYNPEPYPTPNTFVTSYTTFMKLVSVWKWIDSYKNEPHILEHDHTRELLQRTLWQRNIQWTSLEEPDGNF